MRSIGDGAVAIVPGAREVTRSHDTSYPFRQASDFAYLTGFAEPDCVLALVPGRDAGESIVFCRDRDPEAERWDGPRLGPEQALEALGVDDAFPIDDIDEIFPNLIDGRHRLFYPMGHDPTFDGQVMGWLNELRAAHRRGAKEPEEIITLDYLLSDMRLVKSRAELAAMRRAARVSVRGHERAMRATRPGAFEYEIAAALTYEFALANAEHAYLPIVGGGSNACVLHYLANNDALRDGDLLLVDAGAEVDGYAADITRTFPVNGKFTAAQRDIYDLVLQAQYAAIDSVSPGANFDAPHQAALAVIAQGLVDLKLVKMSVDECLESAAYRRFFMHKSSHWLGMDVHDVGDYKIDGEWRAFEVGMVLTIEPGIYVPPETRGIPKQFKGIGVRIEDDVAVTREGNEVLTRRLVKNPDDVEALMRDE